MRALNIAMAIVLLSIGAVACGQSANDGDENQLPRLLTDEEFLGASAEPTPIWDETQTTKFDPDAYLAEKRGGDIFDKIEDDFYVERGAAKIESEDYEGAIADYTTAISLNPQNYWAYNNRGVVKTNELGDHKGAIADFTKAIELDPKDGDYYHNRGLAKNRLGDYEGAIADCTKAIELNPKDDIAHYCRGLVKCKLGDYEGAIADFTKAIRLNPKNSYAYSNRGYAKDELGDQAGAIVDYTKAIELDPKNDSAYLNRGACKYNLGDREDAIADWRKAGALGNKHAWDNIRAVTAGNRASGYIHPPPARPRGITKSCG